jgi:NitT/TauT family transport system substrate-binding protein
MIQTSVPGMRRLARAATAAAAIAVLPSLMTGQALAQTKVRYVEVVRSLAYLPSYVALAKGYFKQEGLDVDMSTAQGGDKATAQILGGRADITLLGPETTVYVQNSVSPEKLRIFCSLTARDLFFLMSRKKIEPAQFKWSSLKGKTVLGWRPGSTPQLFLEAALRKHGLDPAKDMNIVTNIAIPARIGAWMAGQGQFGIFQEPNISRMVKDGKAFPFASVGQETGTIDYTVFAATTSYIKKNPKTVQAWTNAIYKAQKFTSKAKAAELAKLVSSYFPAVSRDLLETGIDRYRKIALWRTDPLVPKDAIEKLQDILIAGGVQKSDQRVKYEDIVVTKFAEQARKSVH